MEDRFISSAPNDEQVAPPLSIVMDSQAPYFDTTRPNNLTDLVANSNFEQSGYDENLAQEIFYYYVAHRVSKYNHQPYVDVRPIYGDRDRYRILVLRQVPYDDALKYGGGIDVTLLDIVKQAIKENPDAQIRVKTHPVTFDNVYIVSKLTELDCLVLTQPIHLVDALETIDHVYTITSLGGLEALLRGKKVTVLGKPFYAKWCNNNDSNDVRADRRLLSQLFYACYYGYHFNLLPK